MDPSVSGARTEDEIKRNWRYSGSPLVSIRCTAYNHEPYIRDAIEGFLMQETDFPFEIVIHDDASTDGTADIIREYEAKYPRLINPIYQVENQHSKEGKPATRILNKKMRGEFVAVCEGDDYWTDPLKLQIQIDEMRKYPECDICFHSATMIYQDKSRPDKVFGNHRDQTEVIPLSEVIRGGGEFIPTASIVISKGVLENIPEWFYTTAPVGDLFWQIYGSKRGGALFIDRNMAVYRAMAPGSWSQKMRDKDVVFSSIQSIIECLKMIKKELKIKEGTDIDYLIAGYDLDLAIISLKNKSFQAFKRYIRKSWTAFPNRCVKQKLLFLTKSVPRIAYFYYRVSIHVRKSFFSTLHL